ncbi:hypothetical protein HER32_13940 [Hymenobacter sp. BT18]|uniref:hypothetical protein n=1 Tax=Hymenobacter sp. BT18 TaxID=2835648 RepID=UPI00143E1028|nr:hypothetical protein [Hymenobacter sp. BT18]QIX62220.1 hypothetical protein HER32_13940 [Hymenobacter sp. BT18]
MRNTIMKLGLFIAALLLLSKRANGQELREDSIFTTKQIQHLAHLEPQATNNLQRISYYETGAVASATCYRYLSGQRRLKNYRRYTFYPTGPICSRACQDMFGFLRIKTWNQVGQLVRVYRRNPTHSTNFTYLTRQYAYQNNQVVKTKVTKVRSGCFRYKVLRNKTIELTEKGKVITAYAEEGTPIDSVFQKAQD